MFLNLFLLMFVQLSEIRCIDDSDQVTDTNLDILFILDQAARKVEVLGENWRPEYCKNVRMQNIHDAKYKWCAETDFYDSVPFENISNYMYIYDGLQNWVTSFFDKVASKNTQFAVIHSCDNKTGGVFHYFMDNDFKKKIPAMISRDAAGVRKGCKRNFAWTIDLAAKDVFNTKKGHRLNASSVVIVVSDCNVEPTVYEHGNRLPEDEQGQKLALTNFFEKVKGQVYFVCYNFHYEYIESNFVYNKESYKNRMVGWLKTLNNQSEKSMMYFGMDVNEVGRRLDELMPKRSGVKDVDCNQTIKCDVPCGWYAEDRKCYSEKCTWDVFQAATGNGKDCTKNDTIFRELCQCPVTTPPPKQSAPIWIIVVAIAGALVGVVAILIAVAFVVKAKRRNKRARDKAVGGRQGSGVKKVEIDVDLSTAQRSGTSAGSKVGSVSKKVSVGKSFSKKGSKVTGKSKSAFKPKGSSESKASSVSQAKTSIVFKSDVSKRKDSTKK